MEPQNEQNGQKEFQNLQLKRLAALQVLNLTKQTEIGGEHQSNEPLEKCKGIAVINRNSYERSTFQYESTTTATCPWPWLPALSSLVKEISQKSTLANARGSVDYSNKPNPTTLRERVHEEHLSCKR